MFTYCSLFDSVVSPPHGRDDWSGNGCQLEAACPLCVWKARWDEVNPSLPLDLRTRYGDPGGDARARLSPCSGRGTPALPDMR